MICKCLKSTRCLEHRHQQSLIKFQKRPVSAATQSMRSNRSHPVSRSHSRQGYDNSIKSISRRHSVPRLEKPVSCFKYKIFLCIEDISKILFNSLLLGFTGVGYPFFHKYLMRVEAINVQVLLWCPSCCVSIGGAAVSSKL